MKEFEIKNMVGLLQGDVIVDVDIRFLPISPPNSQEEKLSLAKADADFGVLAHEIKQEIREKIRKYFND